MSRRPSAHWARPNILPPSARRCRPSGKRRHPRRPGRSARNSASPPTASAGNSFKKADAEIACRHDFRRGGDPREIGELGREGGGGEFRRHAGADQKPRARGTGLHDIGGALHRPGADDDFRQLSCDCGDRGRRRRRSERHLDQPQPAVEQRPGERHRILLALDGQDRDDGNATEQGMHAFLLRLHAMLRLGPLKHSSRCAKGAALRRSARSTEKAESALASSSNRSRRKPKSLARLTVPIARRI